MRARRVRVLAGALPVERRHWLSEAVAGATLAALAVPEVLGYARIAGMPVVTGLYTMLLPAVVFVLFGASRHLVVGADSATAAILAAALTGLAATGSPHYTALAGTATLVLAVLLALARLVRLGFLANFLSRTVLVGFLTGVGVQVALGQLPDLLGLAPGSGSLPARLAHLVGELGGVSLPTLAVGLGAIAIVVAGRRLDPRIPAALVVVVAAIAADALFDLGASGVAVLGPVPAGLPGLALPALSPSDLAATLPAAASMLVVVLAQSAATARAYAARFDETADTDTDLVGLAGANLAATVTGAFVVNGSPTKTQMVVGAGGRSQLAQLASVVVVVVVCLVATGPLAHLPLAALAAVVFLIGVELVDVAGLRRILAVRRAEFGVALLTAVAVIVLGVEDGILIAVVVSIVDHLRHSYSPHNAVLVKSPAGHWRSEPITLGARTSGGLVVYRFGSGMYFANAARVVADIETLLAAGPDLHWFCLDAAAIGDVDFTASTVLAGVFARLRARGVHVVASNLAVGVRTELERYGLSPDAWYDTSGEALADYAKEHGHG
ncbi:SulP family inorganic anion transporter [Pseudonocardia sp. NPDC049154]|uniref:SulP family inorganic anion transporter n=1 Tax=Pseudonocardia sp. NPDC049154 TaxID=3155501 RepID=UPI0033D6173C